MTDFSSMTFRTSPGVNNAKRMAVDDFSFEVPCLTEASLSDLLDGGVLCSGDKEFSDFSYHGGGDMPAAEDIFVKAITDADGNFGIRYQGAFVDGVGGGASDALIDFKVTAPDGKLIKDVHLAANPLVIGGDVDSDGNVDGADFLSWQRHFANFSAPIASTTTVPEPTALLLLSSGALMLLSRRRLAYPCRHKRIQRPNTQPSRYFSNRPCESARRSLLLPLPSCGNCR